jgi:mannose-6-phosphate isomerase-like protein (cupin superfamily)
MDELDVGLTISVTGELRDEALAACARQLKAWEVAMPPVDPLVLDFGLGDFYRTGLIEYWVTNEIEAGYCGKFLFLFDGQTCPLHHHRTKLETFCIQRGVVRMHYRGREWDMQPGEVLRAETNHPHQFSGVGPALILEVSKPCVIADNYFADACIPIGGNCRKSSS